MHIKKLEISGFKSFVDRTVIHFDHDIIGIVGPNGCGKSNIVDAIRWCMGEQSARHLRGKSMEDVIFNGSETRPAHGLAEVTLTFDNSDPEQAATLPLEFRDYSEIAVTRRLHRDGTSEYLINKAQVRLRDIVELFLGTGVGTKAYSIVEQGRIGLIVSARPEDRRMLIEEAAGITKYKARKRASERRMEQTEQNLLRVGDRVAELERNVASLRRQAQKAERYIAYRGELEELQLHTYSHQLLELIVREDFALAQRAAAEAQAETARNELQARELELETARNEALVIEQMTEKAQNDAFNADNQVRTFEAEITRARDRLAHLRNRAEAASRERVDLIHRAEALASERERITESLANLEEEESYAASAALDEHETLESLRESEQAADAALQEHRLRASSASSQVAAAEAKLSAFERRLGELDIRRNRLRTEAEALTTEHAELLTSREDLEGRVEALTLQREMAQDERASIESEQASLKEAFSVSERNLENAKRDLERERARLRALEEVHARLEGVGDGVKHLLETKDAALLGLVADRVEAAEELTEAVAGLLGDALETIVVRDAESAAPLLSQLAESQRGRAAMIPISPLSPPARDLPPLEGPGILGPLISRLKFASEDAAVIQALVGDALLVETAEVALRLAPQAAGRALVALDGTVILPDGRIRGGSGDRVAAGLVEQQREMRALKESCANLEIELDGIADTHEELRERSSGIGMALEEARQRAHEAELLLVNSQQELRRAEDRFGSVDSRLRTVRGELAEAEKQLAEGSRESEEARLAFEGGRGTLTDAEYAMGTATEIVAQWREKVSSQLSIVTERKVLLARIKEQVAGAKASIERLAENLRELSERDARLEREGTELAEQEGKTAALLVVTREKLHEAVAAAQEAHEALSLSRQRFDEARLRLGEREADLKSLRTRATQASEALNAHEMAIQKLVIERAHLLTHVKDRFRGLDLTKIVGDYHLRPPPSEEHLARTNELIHLIERMGPVNLDAMREHEEESARLEEIVAQKTDLEDALEDLRRAIAQMNRESRRLFRDTFNSVNDRFKTLFPKMFRGGRAELVLTNPEDMLETGIEIAAQPPGKKLGNIELMSGGEKALTAVSLIFALFQHKPSPFCILDEVDAPLDEANVARYNELVREMTDRSQFILITHIKKTMQAVDVLYGVTMQEPGVSRLVSVKVNEAAERRRPARSSDTQVA